MLTGDVRNVAEEMRLDADEMLVLTLLQQFMIGRRCYSSSSSRSNRGPAASTG